MSKIVQFRCAKCFRLLIKYDKSTDLVIYKAEGITEIGTEEGNAMYLLCPKDNVWNQITPKGLVEIDEEKVYNKPKTV